MGGVSSPKARPSGIPLPLGKRGRKCTTLPIPANLKLRRTEGRRKKGFIKEVDPNIGEKRDGGANFSAPLRCYRGEGCRAESKEKPEKDRPKSKAIRSNEASFQHEDPPCIGPEALGGEAGTLSVPQACYKLRRPKDRLAIN